MNKIILTMFLVFVLTISAFAQEPEKLTRENWGGQVGFAPNLKVEGYEPGITIDASNCDKFASILSDTAMTLIKTFGMKIETRAYAPYAPSDGYIALTNKNRGKAKLLPIGDAHKEREIEGYEGGMPFPAPKNGREIAWNYVLSYRGDDGQNQFEVFWISPKRGIERSEGWRTTSIKAKYRSDIPPMPLVPSLVKNGVIGSTLTEALSPNDKKGYASLYYGYLDPKEPNGWLYLPPQKRSIRLTFGTRGEAWNNTDLLYEDVGGFTGSPEWLEWKLVEKKMILAPIHSGVVNEKGKHGEAFDLENSPHFNPNMKWELRPTYVVEAKPKFKQYPYSRMVLYVDAESSHIFAKSSYDRKGELWKLQIHGANPSLDPRKVPPKAALALVVDVQSEHATAFFFYNQKSNIGPDPGMFNLFTLRKLGR